VHGHQLHTAGLLFEDGGLSLFARFVFCLQKFNK
jgi:hypothetical protein